MADKQAINDAADGNAANSEVLLKGWMVYFNSTFANSQMLIKAWLEVTEVDSERIQDGDIKEKVKMCRADLLRKGAKILNCVRTAGLFFFFPEYASDHEFNPEDQALTMDGKFVITVEEVLKEKARGKTSTSKKHSRAN